MSFIVAKKLNMSQHFLENGQVLPVTVLQAKPMTVVRVKTKDSKDGYAAVVVAVSGSVTGKRRLNKAMKGQLKEKGLTKLYEFRVKNPADYTAGQILDLAQFSAGQIIDCVGTMKGRGFAGAIKRHGFSGFPASHGHDRPRSVGSIGQRYPQHTRKGLRMSGHMGTQQVTVKNLQVVHVDSKRHLLSVKGAVPAHRNGVVRLVATGKSKPLGKQVKEEETKKKK